MRHYIKLALRNLFKNKYYTAINILGLTCGMFSALVICKNIGYSHEFDQFHEKKDRIYSVLQQETTNGISQPRANANYWGVGDVISEFQENAMFTRYKLHVEALVIASGKAGQKYSFTENKIFLTDSSFLRIFSFPLSYGNKETALSNPHSVVLTSSEAGKYFGKINPLGKTLAIRTTWGQEDLYTVTGVAKDPPELSRFQFDFLITPSARTASDENWSVLENSTFVLLQKNAVPLAFGQKLTDAVNDKEQIKSTNRKLGITLEPVAQEPLSATSWLLLAVGTFIVLVCWINYLNQVIAQSYWRIKEAAILRSMGAARLDLGIQFSVESTITCSISFSLVLLLYVVFNPWLQTITDHHLLPLFGESTMINGLFALSFLVGTCLASVLPAAILFSKNVNLSMRQITGSVSGNMRLRSALVITQFSISTILVISISVISNQLNLLSSKEKGFNLKNMMVIKSPIAKDTTFDVKKERLNTFKSRCAAIPFIAGVTSSTTVPGEEYRHETFLSLSTKPEKSMVFQNGIDENFFDVYNIKIIAGSVFAAHSSQKNYRSIILNESAARALDITDFSAIDDNVIMDSESGEKFDLVGIVQDYHQTILKYKIQPVAYKFVVTRGHVSIKLNKDSLTAGEKKSLKQAWTEVYPDLYFDSFFIAGRFDSENLKDSSFQVLFNYFTVLSIIISMLGLFGMSLLISAKRKLEIGIRKVFGASPLHIVLTVFRGYLGALVISILLGVPVALLLMNAWLQEYSYRIAITAELVLRAIACSAAIFILAISYQTIRSSLADPVKTLKE